MKANWFPATALPTLQAMPMIGYSMSLLMLHLEFCPVDMLDTYPDDSKLYTTFGGASASTSGSATTSTTAT
jgi:hypothetical protein